MASTLHPDVTFSFGNGGGGVRLVGRTPRASLEAENAREEMELFLSSTMKTAAVLASLLASASAFAPEQQAARSSTTLAAFNQELGAQPPFGCWDPLGFTEGADQARFNRLREVEIKHGRIAMLAIVGHMVTTAGIRLPGAIDASGKTFASIPAGLAALREVPLFGLAQIALFIGFLDFAIMKDAGKGEFPGDYRNGMFKWDASEEEKTQKRMIELNNGRAAQMGILGLMCHEVMTGEPYVINAWLGYPTHFNEGF